MTKSKKGVNGTSAIEKRIIERLGEFTEALENQENIEDRFECRRRVLKLKPKRYTPQMVKNTRKVIGVSQAEFAAFLGVSPKTVQSWEQGVGNPSNIACRFMDEIQNEPEMYRERMEEIFATPK